MAYRVTWSPTARLDLKGIFVYIAKDNAAAAERFVESIFQAAERAALFPESGRVVPEIQDPEIREVIRKPCRIVYRIVKIRRTIQIVRVWHAARGKPEVYG